MGAYQPTKPGTVQPGRLTTAPTDERTAAKQRAKQEKTLREFGPMLKHLLDIDEHVVFATRACSPFTIGQQLTTGWVIFILKRCVLVFTNKRILHIPTTRSYAPRGSVASIAYGDVAEIKVGSFLGRMLKVRYRSGKKEKFVQIPSFELKRLRELVPTLPLGTGPAGPGVRQSLCPRCKSPLVPKRFVCTRCGLEFKNRKRAALLSVLAPGGGYFYTRHPIMGSLDALVETYLIVFMLALLVTAFTGATSEDVAAGIGGALVFGVILLVEKLVTVSHSFHFVDEFIPMERDPQRLSTAMPSRPSFTPAG